MKMTRWKVIEKYPNYEMNEVGKVRKISTKKYKQTSEDSLGRNIYVFYEESGRSRGRATIWYQDDLLALVFGPKPNQSAIVESEELVSIMPVKPKQTSVRAPKIRCIDTNETFVSYAACARHFGFNYDKFYDTFKATGKYEGHEFEDLKKK